MKVGVLAVLVFRENNMMGGGLANSLEVDDTRLPVPENLNINGGFLHEVLPEREHQVI